MNASLEEVNLQISHSLFLLGFIVKTWLNEAENNYLGLLITEYNNKTMPCDHM